MSQSLLYQHVHVLLSSLLFDYKSQTGAQTQLEKFDVHNFLHLHVLLAAKLSTCYSHSFYMFCYISQNA